MKTQHPETSRLEDLPNVGPTVAGLLESAGIRSPADLRRRGAIAAAERERLWTEHPRRIGRS